MKRKINKETYDKLSDDLKKEYKAEGDEYVLTLDDYEDPAELKRALERERQEKKEAKEEAKRLKEEKEGAEEAKNKDKGNIDALERSYKEKLDKKDKEYGEKLAKKDKFISQTLVDSVAKQIAAELSDAPALLIPHIKSRITADLEADEPTTKVLGADGKASALTVKELTEEFKTNKDFAPIIRGSKAAGAGGGGNPGGSAPKRFADMNDVERTALFKADPVKFNELSAQVETATS